MKPETEKLLDSLLCALGTGKLDDEQRHDLEELLQSDPKARQLYLDYICLDGLLQREFPGDQSDPVDVGFGLRPDPKPIVPLRYVVIAAACLAIGLATWFIFGPARRGGQPDPYDSIAYAPTGSVMLAPGWLGESCGAKYKIISPGDVWLEQGELHIKSVPLKNVDTSRAPLKVKTPNATATATGTEFYVGTHRKYETQDKEMKSITRILVLSGVVALANSYGNVTGETHDLLTADKESAPIKLTVKANSDFAVDLYKQLTKENPKSNMFFSPYSVSTCLSMAAEGARGQTAAEIGRVLRFPEAARRIGKDAQLIPWHTSMIHSGFRQINESLKHGPSEAEDAKMRKEVLALRAKFDEIRDAANAAFRQGNLKKSEDLRKEAYQKRAEAGRLVKLLPDRLCVTNALWAEKSYSINKAFQETLDKHYGTGAIRAADFITNAEAERGRINTWVKDRTGGYIKDLMPAGTLNKLTRMVLVNAVYFKGAWSEPFNRRYTRNGEFTLADGTTSQATFMNADMEDARYGAFTADGKVFNTPHRHRKGRVYYPGKGGFAIAELPYRPGRTSMVVITPMTHDGLGSVERLLTASRLSAWISKLEQRSMVVKLPKFKMEASYKLGDSNSAGALQKMGMVQAFNDPRLPNGANFSGIHHSDDPTKRLFIDSVYHKTVLAIDEEGTMAAGAASVASAAKEESFIPSFSADRPFLLMIRHNATGTILFMGRILNPGTADAE